VDIRSTLSDNDLLSLVREGDHAAFTAIYHRYKRLLYKHAYQRLRNEPEVDDIIHELFTSLWEKRETLAPQINLAGYLYTAVRNRIMDFLARQNVQSGYIGSLQAFMEKTESATDHLLRENQLTALIEKEIAALPPKMREVFELSRKAHLSHKEIAEHLGISEKTVKSQVNNALKILRVKLGFLVWLFMLIYYR